MKHHAEFEIDSGTKIIDGKSKKVAVEGNTPRNIISEINDNTGREHRTEIKGIMANGVLTTVGLRCEIFKEKVDN